MRRATRPAAPRSSRVRSTRGSATLNELDLVAVGILDEGNDGGAEFHRTRRPRDLDAGWLETLAGGIDVGDADGEMAEGGADGIGLLLVPVVGELDHRAAVLAAVADESERVATVRHLALTQHLHAEKPGVEVERFLEIEDAQHGVKKTRIADSGADGGVTGGSRIHSLPPPSLQISP